MTDAEWSDDGEISLFALGATLLRKRWRIARWMVLGGVIAALTVITKKPVYMATASFAPQGAEAGRSGLTNLAGQFGVSLPATNQSLSPDFYVTLLKSRVLLSEIARDTLAVPELGGKRVPILNLFRITGGTPKLREEQGIAALRNLVNAEVAKTTGIVQVSAATPWPSVSLAIVSALVEGVNNYNQQTRHGQAAAERKFVEGRLAAAAMDLREAEDRLQQFLMTNRQFGGSPQLTFDRERIQRVVTTRQQVYASLSQAYEDARIREVRDTPVITMVEPPSVPSLPEPRGRVKRVFLGLLIGAFIGVFLIFVTEFVKRRRQEGDRDADEFVGALADAKNQMLGAFRGSRGRSVERTSDARASSGS